MPPVEILLFGSPLVLFEGTPVEFVRRKAVALIAYLAITDQHHSRDTLAEFLWPDNDAVRSRASLRRVLSTISETPIGRWIDADRDTIALQKDDAIWINIDAFNRLTTQLVQPESLAQAVALYRDNFMAGFFLRDSAAFDHWISTQTQNYQQQFFTALDQLTQAYLQQGQVEQAASTLRRWLSFDPIHETAQHQLIETYARLGQRSAALAQYDQYAAALESELGVSPPVETRQLYERIKSEQSIPQQSATRPVAGTLPPLPSLVVGREDALGEVRRRLSTGGEAGQAQVIIQGWPGIGKTTLSALIAHDGEVQSKYPDGILWTSLGQHPNLLAALVNWGRSLGFYELERAQSVEEASTRLTALLKDRQILVILDDVWAVDHAMPLKVGGARSRLLITTRLNEVARLLADRPDTVYKIPILSPEESLILLRTLAPEVIAGYPAESAELVRDLEGLPLALQVAGRLLHAEAAFGWGVDALLAELREGTRLLESQAPADRSEIALETTPTIAALLRRSVERLPDEMQERFALLGVFAPKPATFALPALAAVWEIDDVRPTVRLFVDRGLLEPAKMGHFQMHALLVMLAKSMVEGLA